MVEASDFSIFYVLKKKAVKNMQGEGCLGRDMGAFFGSAFVHE